MQQQLIAQTISRFVADPSAADSTPSATAHVVDGAIEVVAGTFAWQTDFPPSLGGGNSAPTPVAFLLGSLAGCAAGFIRDTLGPQLGVNIHSVTAVAKCKADARGLLGMDGVDAALADIELEITVGSDEPDNLLEAVYDAWRARCPIYLAILRANTVTLKFGVERRDRAVAV